MLIQAFSYISNRWSTPASDCQPPTVIENKVIQPDLLSDIDDGDQHRSMYQYAQRCRKRTHDITCYDNHQAKRYKPSPIDDSGGLKIKFISGSKVKRRKPKARIPKIKIGISKHQRQLKEKHCQHTKQHSKGTLMKSATHCFHIHRATIPYEVAKKHIKRCRQFCLKLKKINNGAILSVYFWYLGKLSLKNYKAAQFFQRAIDPMHVLKLRQYQSSLSSLYIHCSYAFAGFKKYKKALESCLYSIRTADTSIDLASAYLSCSDIYRALGNYESALLLYRFVIKRTRHSIECAPLLYQAHRNAGELCLQFNCQEIAAFYFQSAYSYLEFVNSKESFQLIAQLVRLLPIPRNVRPSSFRNLVIVDLCGLVCTHSARVEPILRLFPFEVVHHPHMESNFHIHQDITVVEFEEAEEEQGENYELTYLPVPLNNVESPGLFDGPLVKLFNVNMSVEHAADNTSICVQESEQWRPNFVVSHVTDIPDTIKPFVELCGDSYFRGMNVCAKGSNFNLAVCFQSRFHQEILRLKTTQFGMHSSTPTIYLALVKDTLLFRFSHHSGENDCFKLCLNKCVFNQLFEHTHNRVSLRLYIQGISPQATVQNQPPFPSVRAHSPITVIISSESVMCIIGSSAASRVKIGEGDSIYLSALPSSKTEAQGVAYILRTKPLLDEHATKGTVLRLMEKSTIIHLASHGIVHQGCFALVLDPGQISCDSVLTSHDIKKLNLSAVIVVLSSCDSGCGTVNTDGIQGMASAFIQAGAQSVLTTQSKVPDKSASVFMQCFHWYLSHGIPSFDALDRAKHSMRLIHEYSKNIHWNQYQLHGREVILQSSTQLISHFGCRSAFPCLQIICELERAILDQPALPTAVQVYYCSVNYDIS